MQPDLAIILVNWNGYALTKDCIDSLAKTSYQNYTIIVVDNGSEDGSAAKLKRDYQNIVLLELPENKGFTGGNNHAMEWAIKEGFKYSLLLNNDTFVESDFLEPLLQTMNEHPLVGAVQPLICFNYDRNKIWNAGSFRNPIWGYCYTQGYLQNRSEKFAQERKVDWISGCAFLVRNEALQQVGLFQENLFTYYEDVDLSYRLRNSGYELRFIPSSVIYHIAGMSGKSVSKGKEGFLHAQTHFYNVRNRIWFLKKYSNFLQLPTVFLYHVAYFTAMLIYFSLRARFTKLQACYKGIQAGLIMK